MNTTSTNERPDVLAEHLLLLLHHPETGRRLVSSDKADLALGGALLVELTERQRIDLTEPHRMTKNRTVVVVDPTPTGDDVLDEALPGSTQRPTRHLTPNPRRRPRPRLPPGAGADHKDHG